MKVKKRKSLIFADMYHVEEKAVCADRCWSSSTGGTSKGVVYSLLPIGRSLSAETVRHSPGQDPHDSVVIQQSRGEERRGEVRTGDCLTL